MSGFRKELDHYLDQSKELAPTRQLAFQILEATHLGAIGAALVAGQGDKKLADQEAVTAMLSYLNGLDISGRMVMSEGEKDKAPMIEINDRLGTGRGPELDMAVDPLENTEAAAFFKREGAISTLAVSEPGGLLEAPALHYMDKLIVGPAARGKVDIDAPVAQNLGEIAKALKRDVSDLVIVVLDRTVDPDPRNAELVRAIRQTGAKPRLIKHGDLFPGIAACMRGSGVHAVMGIGGAPEGVITAAGLRCLGGGMQARPWFKDESAKDNFINTGGDPNRIYTEMDLASGQMLIFSATGVTDSEILKGVRFIEGEGARTDSLLIYSLGSTVEVLRLDGTQFKEGQLEFKL